MKLSKIFIQHKCYKRVFLNLSLEENESKESNGTNKSLNHMFLNHLKELTKTMKQK